MSSPLSPLSYSKMLLAILRIASILREMKFCLLAIVNAVGGAVDISGYYERFILEV